MCSCCLEFAGHDDCVTILNTFYTDRRSFCSVILYHQAVPYVDCFPAGSQFKARAEKFTQETHLSMYSHFTVIHWIFQ